VLSFLTIALSYSAVEETTKISLQDYATEQSFAPFKSFCEELKKKVVSLTSNGKGCLLNLLDSQFYLFDLMEKELKGGTPSQEKIEAMMQGFEKALKTFEAQCDQATKDLYEEIQRAIASLVPQEMAASIQTLQEEMQKLYTKAKDKHQLNNDEFQKKMSKLQTELMQKFLYIQTITSIASLEIYEIIYNSVGSEQKNKKLLLRRFDVNGLIPLTKRVKEVTHPKRACELIKSFLSQANSITQDNASN
jgi:hypothetical protein